MSSESPSDQANSDGESCTSIPAPTQSPLDYSRLSLQQIQQTISLLQERISERFPDRGLVKLCERLSDIALQTQARIEEASKPILWLRCTIGSLLSLLFLALTLSLLTAKPANPKGLSLIEILTATESAINDVILLSAGVVFLITWEQRIKRKKALEAVHEIRSLVHIIDMHQLTKDPERLQESHLATESSPKSSLNRYELNRYLDYCSEMLSLAGKLSAIYAQHFSDSVVLAAVGEVESLALGLSNNVWQKISILNTMGDERASPDDARKSR